ncbi:MAG: hypothetical protein ABSF88_01555 [Candidatus Aminicenantales bacterium]|jgi:Tfp pilus assembly protein PilP
MKFVKKVSLFALVAALAAPIGFSQSTPQEGKKKAGPAFSYHAGDRRDPFKDLFGGKEVRDKRAIGGLADLSIDDITLMGIVKSQGNLVAILSLTEGFPLTIHEGDRLADGFVASIDASRVVFRKTRDSKGLPLAKPRDIIKEIMPEEREYE